MGGRKPARVRLHRAYDVPSSDDGYRVLVDRVWPRGVSKDQLEIDEWIRELAPSTSLRKWFNHDPDRWSEFKRRYFLELEFEPEVVHRLVEHATKGPVTLVFGARDRELNNAVALRDFLVEKLAGRRE